MKAGGLKGLKAWGGGGRQIRPAERFIYSTLQEKGRRIEPLLAEPHYHV